jgi:hypothetical protein
MTFTSLKPAAKLSRGRHSPIGFFEYRFLEPRSDIAPSGPLLLLFPTRSNSRRSLSDKSCRNVRFYVGSPMQSGDATPDLSTERTTMENAPGTALTWEPMTTDNLAGIRALALRDFSFLGARN